MAKLHESAVYTTEQALTAEEVRRARAADTHDTPRRALPRLEATRSKPTTED